MKFIRCCLLAMLFFVPLYSMAWGVLGHRVTGAIAETYLTPKAKKEIEKLLGFESLAMASNWADFIKSDSSYDYIMPWHYINLPEHLTAAELNEYLRKDTSTDLYTRLTFIIAQLKSKATLKEKKVFYLKLLIHFVGDAHQPMHTAHLADKGGNNLKLLWFNNPSNLHRIWDENLIEFQQLSYTEHAAAINHASAAEVKKWQSQRPSEWIAESYSICEKLYTEVNAGDKLGYDYNYSHVNMLNRQLLKGGVRLAGLLNSIFA